MKRKYEVSGTDDLGDMHISRLTIATRAEEVAGVMRENLENVELQENASCAPGLAFA